jgi:hypothetical protein
LKSEEIFLAKHFLQLNRKFPWPGPQREYLLGSRGRSEVFSTNPRNGGKPDGRTINLARHIGRNREFLPSNNSAWQPEAGLKRRNCRRSGLFLYQ